MCSVCPRQVHYLSTIHSFPAIVTMKGHRPNNDICASVCGAHAWRAPLLMSLSGGPRLLAASRKGPPGDRSSPISRVSTRAQKAGRGTGALPSSHEPPTCQWHLTVMAFLLPLGPKCCVLTLAIKACEEILLEYSNGPHGSSRIFFFFCLHVTISAFLKNQLL